MCDEVATGLVLERRGPGSTFLHRWACFQQSDRARKHRKRFVFKEKRVEDALIRQVRGEETMGRRRGRRNPLFPGFLRVPSANLPLSIPRRFFNPPFRTLSRILIGPAIPRYDRTRRDKAR